MAICVEPWSGGAMFGDNLSIISDTTIAAVKPRGCEMKDKYKANFFIALPAAVLLTLLFVAITWGKKLCAAGEHPYQIIRVLPYLECWPMLGVNVFVVLLFETVFFTGGGSWNRRFAVSEIFTVIGEGGPGCMILP